MFTGLLMVSLTGLVSISKGQQIKQQPLQEGTSAIAHEGAGLYARRGTAALVQKNNSKAITALSKALQSDSLPVFMKAAILNDRGLAYAKLYNIPAALGDFNAAVQIYPEYAVVYNNRGHVLHQMGYYAEAIRDFDRAIILDPSMGVSFHNRGNAYFQLQKYDTAFENFTKANRLLVDNPAPHLGRGKVHQAEGRHFAALREYSFAINKRSNYAAALFARVEYYQQQRNYAAALRDLHKVIALQPDNQHYLLKRAVLYGLRGQMTAALADYNKIIKHAPHHPQALIGRGAVYGRLKKWNKALADLNLAIEKHPAQAMAWAERGYIKYSLKQYELAEEDADFARQRKPQTARSWALLGVIAMGLGKGEIAKQNFQQALALDDHQSLALKGIKKLQLTIAPPQLQSVSEEMDQWVVYRDNNQKYWAKNPRYKNLLVPLELYGNQKPQLLEWTLLSGKYRGIGLLRYDSPNRGSSNDNRDNKGNTDITAKVTHSPNEYVAIIDLYNHKTLSVEPYLLGNKVATWSWSPLTVAVTDPDGVSHTVILRKPKPKPIIPKKDNWFWSRVPFWTTGEQRDAYRKPVRKQRQRKHRRSSQDPIGLFR